MSECERMIPVSRRPDHAEERCGRAAVATVHTTGRVWRACVEHGISAEGAGAHVTWHDQEARPLVSFVFSFGHGQTHPVTGAPLANRFLEIPAETWEAARVAMVRRFGTRWGFQYESRQAAGTVKYELRPLEGDDALGLLVGTTERERACSLCPCMDRSVSRRDHGPDAPTCECACHVEDDEEHQEQRERDFHASQDPESHRGPDGILGNDFRDGRDA